MNTQVLFSSKKDNWTTPQDFYDKLNNEFHFNLDSCADKENHKCEKYFTIDEDGLTQDWAGYTVFCNPPYCRQTEKWVKKAFEESQKPDTKVVMLLPCRPDVKWFHDYCLPYAEIRYIKGRLKFGKSKNSAPFPSMICIFPKQHKTDVETNIFDIEELYENCTVQILKNSVTGEISVGWWENA